MSSGEFQQRKEMKAMKRYEMKMLKNPTHHCIGDVKECLQWATAEETTIELNYRSIQTIQNETEEKERVKNRNRLSVSVRQIYDSLKYMQLDFQQEKKQVTGQKKFFNR